MRVTPGKKSYFRVSSVDPTNFKWLTETEEGEHFSVINKKGKKRKTYSKKVEYTTADEINCSGIADKFSKVLNKRNILVRHHNETVRSKA